MLIPKDDLQGARFTPTARLRRTVPPGSRRLTEPRDQIPLAEPNMVDSTRKYRKYLEPQVLAKISGLQLRARLIVEGFFSGMHRSPLRGLSIEFADHRSYTQGDDLRHIDWKVYGKTDKYYIKEYEQETNLDLMLVVDASASMQYRSARAPLSKYEYGTAVAAALAYLALQQRDSVGLAVCTEHLERFLRPTNYAHQWRSLIDELERQPGEAQTSLGRALTELAERLPRRMLVVIVSDLLDDADEILTALRLLRYRRHDLVVCHVLDPAELTFPFKGPTRFEGLEQGGGGCWSNREASSNAISKSWPAFSGVCAWAAGSCAWTTASSIR